MLFSNKISQQQRKISNKFMSKRDTAMCAFKICLSERNIAKNANDVLLGLIITVRGLETASER